MNVLNYSNNIPDKIKPVPGSSCIKVGIFLHKHAIKNPALLQGFILQRRLKDGYPY